MKIISKQRHRYIFSALAIVLLSLSKTSYADHEGQIIGDELPRGTITLTYDDAPGRMTLPIAQYLAEQGISATFFANGCHFEDEPESHSSGSSSCRNTDRDRYPISLLDELIALGHRIGNHTQDHVVLPEAPYSVIISQLRSMQFLLRRHIHDSVFTLRPPGNAWDTRVHLTVNADLFLSRVHGPFFHDVPGHDAPDSDHDWHCLRQLNASGNFINSPEDCADRLLEYLPIWPLSRGIVQLHDRHYETETSTNPNDWDRTLRLTQHFVSEARRRGYTFAPLDAIPGVLGKRRFLHDAHPSTAVFTDRQGWQSSKAYWGSLRMADIDGDNQPEMCGRRPQGIYCYEYDNNRLTNGRYWSFDFSDDNGYRSPQHGANVQFGDLDGDGDDDVCARRADGIYCALSYAERWWLAPHLRTFGPATKWSSGNNFSDTTGWAERESYWASFRLGDVTEDGRADLCARGSIGIVCAETEGNQFLPMRVWKQDDFGDRHGYDATRYGATMLLGDVNSDGANDVCMRAVWGIRCALNNRAGNFGPSREWTHGPFSDFDDWQQESSWRSIQFVQLREDEPISLCGRVPSGVVCATSNGNTFERYQYLINQDMRDSDGWNINRYGGTLMFGDMTDDGLADVCGRAPGLDSGIVCAHGVGL